MDRYGYGTFRVGGRDGYTEKAYRFSWMAFIGPIPDGLCVCHACDNPSCVNPSHLFLGTHKDNMQDAWRKGRIKGHGRGGGFGDRNGTHTHPERYPRGETHNFARLTEAEVRAILAEHAAGRTVYRIAKDRSLSWWCVGRIVRKIGWKHLHDPELRAA